MKAKIFLKKTRNYLYMLALALSTMANAQLPWTPAESNYTLDIEPSFPPVPGTTYVWTIPTIPQPLMGHNPPPVVLDAGGVLMVNVTATDLQGNIISYNQPVNIIEPAFPISVTSQDGLSVNVQAQFPLVPNFDYLLSFDGGVTNTPLLPNGTATITVPQFGTYELCISVFNPLGELMGIPTCIPVEFLPFCPAPMFQDFTLIAPDSVHCGSPAGICVTVGGTASAEDYCMNIDWGDGQTSEGVSMGLCPFHWYECDGFYDVTVTIYCCDYPTAIPVVIEHTLQVWCHCLTPPAEAFAMFAATDNGDACDHVGACLYLVDGFNYEDFSDYCVSWDWGDGSPEQGSYVGQCPIQHIYDCNGTFDITATIYCCSDPCTSTSLQYSVTVGCVCDVNIDAAAFITSVENCAVNMAFYGGCSDYCKSWDWGDGSVTEGNDLSHTYAASGTYVVELTVYCCDNPSSFQKFYREVEVNCDCDLPSLNNFPIDALQVGIVPGPLCDIAAGSLLYPDGVDPTQYCVRWTWGDGSDPEEYGLGETAFHAYTDNGTYVVCASIFCCSDSLQSVLIGCQSVSVNCQNPQPCAVFPSLYSSPAPGGLTEIVFNNQYAENTQLDSGMAVIYFDNQLIVESFTYHEPPPYQWLVDLENGNYNIVHVLYGINGSSTCSATMSEPLFINNPVCAVYPSLSLNGNTENGYSVNTNIQYGTGTTQGAQTIEVTDGFNTVVASYTYPDGSPIQQNIGTLAPGDYTVTLTAEGFLGMPGCSATASIPLSVPLVCPGDLDSNNIVNITDLLIMISAYGSSCN